MTTYYVDATLGNDGAAGTSELAPWKTIDPKVNGATFSGGDSIKFKKGEDWSGQQLLPPSSGGDGTEITFTHYGAGADPIIDATNLISGAWTEVVGDAHNDAVLAMESLDLITFWPMNESEGTTADNLEGTAARDGTYSNVVLAQTGIGDGETSVQFVNSLAYLNIDTASLDAAFDGTKGSFQAWIKATGSGTWTDSATGFIMRLYGSADDFLDIIDHPDNNKLRFRYSAGGVEKSIEVAESRTGWLYINVTWSDGDNGDEFKAYINHVQVGETQIGFGSWVAASITYGFIGNMWAGATSPWLGYIAKPAIWTKVLTLAQITTLHNTVLGTSEYWATLAAVPTAVFEDNTTLTEGTEGSLAVGEWDHNAGNDRLYIRTSGDDDPAGYAIEWCNQDESISTNGKQWLIFDGLAVGVPWDGSSGAGILLNAANNIAQNCTVTGDKEGDMITGTKVTATACSVLTNDISHVQYGILVYPAGNITGLIDGNTIHDLDKGTASDADGIKISAEVDYDGLVVSNNDISGFQEDGIDAYNAKNAVIENNYIHDNGTDYTDVSGIKSGAYATGLVIRYNKIKDVTRAGSGAGILVMGNNSEVYYNLVIGTDDGIHVYDGPTGVTVYNNTISGALADGMRVTGDNATATMQNNIFDGTGDDFEINCSGGTVTGGYNCLVNDAAVVETAGTYNGGANDLGSTDPLFSNPDIDDFSLQPNSPCINAGVDVGLDRDFAGNPVPQGVAPDIGALEHGDAQRRRSIDGTFYSINTPIGLSDGKI